MRAEPRAMPERDWMLQRLTGLLARVRRQPSDFPGVAALAAAGGFGATRLNHLFRLHLHTTPAAFLQRARVEAAQRIQLETDRPLMEASFESGFASGTVFYESFRRLTGLSPRTWRRLRRQSVRHECRCRRRRCRRRGHRQRGRSCVRPGRVS